MILSMTSADKKESGAPPGATMNQTAVSIFSAVGVVLTLGGLMVTEHNSLRGEINGLRTEMIEGQSALRTEISGLRDDMREDQAALRAEMIEIRGDVNEIRVILSDMGERVARIETRLDLPGPD